MNLQPTNYSESVMYCIAKERDLRPIELDGVHDFSV